MTPEPTTFRISKADRAQLRFRWATVPIAVAIVLAILGLTVLTYPLFSTESIFALHMFIGMAGFSVVWGLQQYRIGFQQKWLAWEFVLSAEGIEKRIEGDTIEYFRWDDVSEVTGGIHRMYSLTSLLAPIPKTTVRTASGLEITLCPPGNIPHDVSWELFRKCAKFARRNPAVAAAFESVIRRYEERFAPTLRMHFIVQSLPGVLLVMSVLSIPFPSVEQAFSIDFPVHFVGALILSPILFIATHLWIKESHKKVNPD